MRVARSVPYNTPTEAIRVLYAVAESQDQELNAAIAQDMTLGPGASFLLLMIYVPVSLTGMDANINYPAIGVIGCITSLLSVIAGFGLASTIAPFHSATPMVVFLLMGIGVDDMYVIVEKFHQADGSTHEVRVGQALREAGPAIMATTATTVVVFLGGWYSSIQAIKWFCQYCVIGVLVDFCLQVSLFVAWMSCITGGCCTSKVDSEETVVREIEETMAVQAIEDTRGEKEVQATRVEMVVVGQMAPSLEMDHPWVEESSVDFLLCRGCSGTTAERGVSPMMIIPPLDPLDGTPPVPEIDTGMVEHEEPQSEAGEVRGEGGGSGEDGVVDGASDGGNEGWGLFHQMFRLMFWWGRHTRFISKPNPKLNLFIQTLTLSLTLYGGC